MEQQVQYSFFSFLSLLLGLVVLTSSCEHFDKLPKPDKPGGKDKIKTFYGREIRVGDGVAQSWVSVDEQGNPLSIGVNVSEQAVESLGDEHEVFTLDLPKQAEGTLYDHITLDWNPHGHPAVGVYDIPHFDLHAYMISEEERATIPFLPPLDENDQPQFDELPASVYVPEDYRPDPGIVPAMGVHWSDSEAPELHGEAFTQTFIYGSHDGEFMFHEPMFTLAYLRDLKQMDDGYESFEIKQPEEYQTPGYHPMEYSFKYDPTPRMYAISLDNLVLQP